MKAKVPIEITEAAGDWFDVLSSGPANVSQREAFVDWMGQSPVHVAEFLRVSALHAELSDSLTLLPEWTEEILRKEGASSAPLFEVRGGDSEAMTASPRLTATLTTTTMTTPTTTAATVFTTTTTTATMTTVTTPAATTGERAMGTTATSPLRPLLPRPLFPLHFF